MERLSDAAIEIVNELHRERLDYNSEYVPLINALNCLAAYEDTGLEPDSIEEAKEAVGRAAIELAYYHKAEQEGRLLVPPCKVGDAVYLPTKNDWGDLLSFEVIEIGVDRDGPFFVIDNEEHDHIPMSDIGADVFLSREEAEAALEKEDDNG